MSLVIGTPGVLLLFVQFELNRLNCGIWFLFFSPKRGAATANLEKIQSTEAFKYRNVRISTK